MKHRVRQDRWIRKAKLKKENEAMDVVDVTESAALPELGSEVAEAMRKMVGAMFLYARSVMLFFEIALTITSF